jgi:heme/copper-type cytochrome/quinol oxidase subunit 1
VLGFVFHRLEERSGATSSRAVRAMVGVGVFGGGAWLLIAWYLAGALGVPRRYASQPPPGSEIGWWASIGALILIAGLIVCGVEAIRLARRPHREIARA